MLIAARTFGFKPSFKERVQRFIHSRVWRMDIHPTARIAPSALIDRTWPPGVHIGSNCWVGEKAVILTHDLSRLLHVDTHIGSGTVIGPRAIILPGIAIGRNCVVEPGALVRTDMPDNSVARGNPAVIELREQSESGCRDA